MTWYQNGTFTGTNGNATISGATTAWLANVYPGDTLVDESNARRIYEIASITNNTTIVLAENYAGTTNAGKSYKIMPTSEDRKVVSNLMSRTTELLSKLADGAANTFGVSKTSTGANALLQLLLSGVIVGRVGAIGDNNLTLQVSTDGLAFKNGLVINQSSGAVSFPFGVTDLLMPLGTEALPGLAFAGDTDTGLYRLGANWFGISTAGVNRINVNSAGRVSIGFGAVVGAGAFNVFGGIFGETEDGNGIRLTSSNSVASSTSPQVIQRRARGTSAAPTAILAGDQIGRNTWYGYKATGFGAINATIQVEAEENFTDSVSGTRMRFLTTLTGAGSITERMRFAGTGNLGIGVTTPTAPLHISGALRTGSSTVAGLPAASAIGAGGLIWCSNCPGGAQFVQCNGTNWLKLSDLSVVA